MLQAKNIRAYLFLLFSVACVSTSTVMLGEPRQYPAVDPSQVAVFMSEEDVPGDFTKIAYISAEGAHGWTSQRGMVEKVQREAAKLGANGVIVNAIDEPSAGSKIAASVLGTTAQRTGQMLAIRYDASTQTAFRGVPIIGDFQLPNAVDVYGSMDSTTAPVVHLDEGTVVSVVGQASEWATVRWAVGKEGYMRLADVEVPAAPVGKSIGGPCADSLYLALRKLDLNKMTDREFAIFQERDKACIAYQREKKSGGN